MSRRVGIETSLAISEAVMQARAEVISAYPITPQTHIVEHLSELVANGELDAEFIPVESKHSAMSAAIGSAAAGARVYTATAAQGLALMHEILFITSSMRLPMVMTVANRALSGPISIWNDHSDIMAERDIGWIQLFVEDAQEAYEATIMAFKIAEDHRVLLPVIVNMDGFILSHVIEPVIFHDQEKIDAFLPEYKPAQKLDPANPITMGPVGVPEVYMEAKKQGEQALLDSKAVVKEVYDAFNKAFDRSYDLVETNGKTDGETMFVTMGSLGETTWSAVEKLNDAGKDVGQIRLKLWRPFPVEEFKAAAKNAKRLIVIDRALSPGSVSGPVAQELKSIYYGDAGAPEIVNVITGLGGRDVPVSDFEAMYEQAQAGKLADTYTIWGLNCNA
ncbi:MAG: pyruvate ferredoxin oxidoreductase [Desulfovibrionaceae bacterium]